MPLEEMHPCDLQSSMLKGCTPVANASDPNDFYKEDQRKKIRTIYYAMIAEFDAMVGKYMDTVKCVERQPPTARTGSAVGSAHTSRAFLLSVGLTAKDCAFCLWSVCCVLLRCVVCGGCCAIKELLACGSKP